MWMPACMRFSGKCSGKMTNSVSESFERVPDPEGNAEKPWVWFLLLFVPSVNIVCLTAPEGVGHSFGDVPAPCGVQNR